MQTQFLIGALGSALLALALGEGVAQAHESHPSVTAEVQPRSGSQVQGMLTFMEHDGDVTIRGRITGLSPGKHGIHIHTNGNCDALDGMSAGGHYSPAGGRHNAPTEANRHLGDLGNIVAGPDGVAEINLAAEDVSLALIGMKSIVDRAIVIHAKEDDFTDPTGNSGARVGCGVIEQNMMRM